MILNVNSRSNANSIAVGDAKATVDSTSSTDEVFEKNEFRFNGAARCVKPGKRPNVRLNHIQYQGRRRIADALNPAKDPISDSAILNIKVGDHKHHRQMHLTWQKALCQTKP